MRFARIGVVISFLVVVSACGRPTVASSEPSVGGGPPVPVNVVLGLYSGRSDPGWTLTTKQAATLDGLLAALPDSTGTPPVGGLGYHGFTNLFPGSTLIAFQGVVAPPGDGPRIVKADPNRSVERYLLETSGSHLSAGERAEAERALAEP